MSELTTKSYSVTELEGLPLLGMAVPAIKNPIGFMIDLSQRYGDIVSFKVLGQRSIQLNHPDLIHRVLVENHKNYRKSRPYIRFESALGLGLLTSNGEKWRQDRQKIQPMFNRERIGSYYFEVASDVAEKYKRKWLEATGRGRAEVNITDEMADITTEVILKSIFGRDISDEVVASLHHSYNVMMEYLKNIRIFSKIDMRKIFHTPTYLEFRKELHSVNEVIKMLTDKYRHEVLDDRYNMLALLVKAQKADPENFSDTDIRDHCATMVFAGFESTSILMQWLWYALDERPDVAQKLREEIVRCAPCTAQLDSTSLTFEQIQKMDYLGMVIKETMRLYPSFWITGREPIEDDYFGDFKVPKGTAVVVPQLAMHRHPKWWDHPNSFIPERFAPEREAAMLPGQYFPFSLGPRKCAGYIFVDMEAKAIAAKLLPLFEVIALNKADNVMATGVSLKLREPLRGEIRRHAPAFESERMKSAVGG